MFYTIENNNYKKEERILKNILNKKMDGEKKFLKDEQDYILEQYNIIKGLNCRAFVNESRNEDSRNEWQRDFARILYSSSFRRLQGKMQLLGLTTDQFYRNRLTHSLEVEQIAEGIIDVLNSKLDQKIYDNNDIYVVRAACLAHDIGNPPFGHAGEKILDEIMSEQGGYEGNAQTLRILKFLEKKEPEIEGLNLTLRTELSLLKYYKKKVTNERRANKKFIYERKINKKFIYDEQYEDISLKINENKLNNCIRTLDAQIMDLADEIAYCAHDLEDCLGLKVFDIDEFLYEFRLEKNNSTKEKEEYEKAYKVLNEIVEKAKEKANKSNRFNTLEEYKDILKLEITGQIVNLLITDIGVIQISEDDAYKFGTIQKEQLGFKEHSKLAQCLKSITFKCLKRKKHVKLYEEHGEIIIRRLFKLYKIKPELMATEYYNLYNKSSENKNRIICDYIAGMMDNYALKKYEEFFGKIDLRHLLKDDWKKEL